METALRNLKALPQVQMILGTVLYIPVHRILACLLVGLLRCRLSTRTILLTMSDCAALVGRQSMVVEGSCAADVVTSLHCPSQHIACLGF